jgi:hypothetical protein
MLLPTDEAVFVSEEVSAGAGDGVHKERILCRNLCSHSY